MDAITKDILKDIKIFVDNRELKLQHVIEWSTGKVVPGEGEVTYIFPNGDNWRYAGISFTILKALDNRRPQEPKVDRAAQLLIEIDDYLSPHPQNAVFCGSKLHQDIKTWRQHAVPQL
jgi:hypothetical protein